MPELPEVETVCRGLQKALKGVRVRAVEQNRAGLRWPFPENLPVRLKGRKFEKIERRAKYILVTLDKGETLLLHLGMSGRMLLSPNDDAPPAKHDHLLLRFENGVTLRFNDPRRFGVCDLVNTQGLQDHKLLRSLGLEPLGKELTPQKLAALFMGRKTSVKAALMDQRLVVGVGNIYACEALFRAGISPKRQAGKCTTQQLKKLVLAIRKTLEGAIAAGGSSLRDYRQTDGELGYFQHRFAVYGKEGERCPGCDCDFAKTGGIKRIVQAGRSTFYCRTKQN